MQKKYKVVVTDYHYDSIQPYWDVYNQHPDIEFIPLQLTEKEDIMRETEYADAVQCHFDKIDADIIKNMKKCKAIVRNAVGVDNIDLDAASEMKIPVVNVPDYCMDEVSNHAMMLILNCCKKFNLLERSAKSGTWDNEVIKPVHAIRYQTLGLLGCGNIARHLVPKAKAFGMHVIGYDPYLSDETFEKIGVERYTDMDAFLGESDFVNIQLHLTKDTAKMVNKEFLSKMKPSAYLINTARGGIVDEEALAEAIRNKVIAGAGLDVLSSEHVPADHPLLQFDNVIVTPHAAWYSAEAEQTLLTNAALEVVRALHGEPVKHQVNRF